MTAVNHALTGTVIGVTIGHPALALPLALLSHFTCDALPHFGFERSNLKVLRSNNFKLYLMLEAFLCFCIVLALAILQPQHWQLASICAFVAASPDLLWLNRYIRARNRSQWKPSLYSRFAGGIQWFQRPIGAVVEIVWFVAAIALLLPFVR